MSDGMPPPGDKWTVYDHLRAGNDRTVALYRRVEELIHSLGPGSVAVAKTTITFKGTRRGFAGARPTQKGVVGYFDLMRELAPDPRIRSVSPYGRSLFVHQYVLGDDSDLDDTFAGWLEEAYAVGCGAHLLSAAPPPAVERAKQDGARALRRPGRT